MVLESVQLYLYAAHGAVEMLVRAQHGAGRTIDTKEHRWVEYGSWFYLRARPRGTAVLLYERRRSEWAIPPAPAGAGEVLLATLYECLVRETDVDRIVAALKAPAEAAGADVSALNRSTGRIDLHFRPVLALGDVLAALGWKDPVSWPVGIHMSSWLLGPHRPEPRAWGPRINAWIVEVELDGFWPRGEGGADLPELERRGPWLLFDARGCVNNVVRIKFRTPRKWTEESPG